MYHHHPKLQLLNPKFQQHIHNYPSPLLNSSTPFTFSLTKPRSLRIICCLFPTTAHLNADVGNEICGDLRVMFAAGGTGGHIYPAVAIADELKIKNPKTQILFIGTPTGMESTAIPSAGYDFAAVASPPLVRPLLSPQNLFVLPYRLIKSFIESWRQLHDFDPQIVVGTGGYVSFPICLAAALKGLKLVIQEQNSVPGIANWVLSFFADQIFVAYDSTVDCFPRNKCVVCGNPVRLSLQQYVSKTLARMHFFPSLAKMGDSKAKVVLVLGGSLGANSINIALLNLYYQMLMEYKNLFIIWQTGVEAFNEMESLVKNHSRLILTPFLHSMDLAYAAADLIVSRAGAMTCYEILATGKPSILIPSPNVAEGHQFKNASLMADLAGSRVITEDELDSTTLGTAIEGILAWVLQKHCRTSTSIAARVSGTRNTYLVCETLWAWLGYGTSTACVWDRYCIENESLMAEMSERALKAAKPNASAEIVEHILSLVKLSTAK